MNKLVLVVSALVMSMCASAETDAVQVLFPYTIVGRVVDAENKAFDASSEVVLKVTSEEGAVLAQARVYTPGNASAWNFRLGIPVASAHVTGYATKGDTMVVTAYKDGVQYTGLLRGDDARIGQAGASVSVRIMLADDANGNGIADAYEQSKFNYLKRYGIKGEFDPNADYDQDGVSNYAEYLAGTDPFDATDRFGVDIFENDKDYDDRYLKITFEANAGRTYAVKETENVGDAGSWRRGSFKENPQSAETVERVVTSRGEWELKTIYLLKQGEKRFYRLELEQ